MPAVDTTRETITLLHAVYTTITSFYQWKKSRQKGGLGSVVAFTLLSFLLYPCASYFSNYTTRTAAVTAHLQLFRSYKFRFLRERGA